MTLTRTHRLLLLGTLILLAFAIRIHNLDAMSFWHDEGLTPLRSTYSFAKILRNEIDIQGWVTRDTHPPLYYLIANVGERLLGGSDFAWRYVPLLFGVLLVPVVYQIGRKMHNDAVGILAALFAAINPLQVWYAQEARMYTLVVLLMALASYVLWQALQTRDDKRSLVKWLVAYVLLAGAAFWTHYTAAFLILAQGLFWLWILWQAGLKKWIVGGAILAAIVSLPLLSVVGQRLFSTAPETGYTQVPPSVIVQDVVRGFSFGRTVDHGDLLIQLLTIGLWLLLFAGILYKRKAKHGWTARLFLLVYLLAIPLGLMVGSALIKPMYLGVRHIMVGSPAIFLLFARGIVTLWPEQVEARSTWRYVVGAVGLFAVLGASLLSLDNLYGDIQFKKEDNRGLVAYIEASAGDNDVVLYHNALLMPLHEHYSTRDDIALTALPTYPHGANLGTVDDLQALFEQYDRVWYMAEPPPDNRDPENVVGDQINGRLLPVDVRWFHGVNTEMKITAYQSKPLGLENVPVSAESQNWQAEGLSTLRGIEVGKKAVEVVDTLWVELIWDAKPVDNDRGVQLALRAPDGELWVKTVRPFQMEDAPPLPDTPLMRTIYPLQLPQGLPPGTYELLVGAWDASAETALGDWHSATTVEITGESADNAFFAGLHFDNGLHLVDVISTEAVKPGHPLPVTLLWQATEPLEGNLRYQLEVLDSQGDLLRTDSGDVGPDWLPGGSNFPVDTLIAQPIGIYFPPETEPDDFSLRWTILADDNPVPSHFKWLPWHSDTNLYGEVTVEPWPLTTTLTTFVENVDNWVDVVDNQFSTVGKLRAFVHNEDTLTLYWEAAGGTQENLSVFVHIVPSGSTESVAQSDRIPVDWLRPTDGWRTGEILEDTHNLGISLLDSGDYSVYVGFYNPETGARVAVTQDGVPQPDNVLLLTTLSVP
jgi:4-amino-4-deoxy-L-arabinose transferase-like glycosyltransferase